MGLDDYGLEERARAGLEKARGISYACTDSICIANHTALLAAAEGLAMIGVALLLISGTRVLELEPPLELGPAAGAEDEAEASAVAEASESVEVG